PHSLLPPPPSPLSTLFPYTTLFRSLRRRNRGSRWGDLPRRARAAPGQDASVTTDRGRVDQRWSRRAFCLRRWGPRSVDRSGGTVDRKSTRLNSSHEWISYAVFCLKK